MTGRPAQPERLLAEMASAVAADAGATLYLDAGRGALEMVASVPGAARSRARWSPLRGPVPECAVTRLVVGIPDAAGGVVMLERRGLEEFSADDRAVARLYARQLAERVSVDALQPRPGAWASQLEAIQRATAQLLRLTSLDQVGPAICAEIQRVIAYDDARVYKLDDGHDVLDAIAFHSNATPYEGMTPEALAVRIGEGITGWVAAHGTAQIIDDAAADPRTVDVPGSEEPLEESMLLVPLRHERRVLGVIVLSRLGIGRFDEGDLRLLQILADQAAVAIENAQLLAARERMVQELNALLDISQASEQAEDEATLAALLADKLVRASGLEACVISRLDEGSTLLRTVGTSGLCQAVPTCDALDYRLMRRVLRDAEPQLIQLESADVESAVADLMTHLEAQTLLMLPLVVSGRTIGLVELLSRSGRREVGAAELKALRMMANQVGTVLENARLVEQLRTAADIDQVTGVHNHRYLQDRLKQECARSARSHSPLSVLMIDLDGFKAVNDQYGHADGDRVLRAVAGGLKQTVRTNDVVARYGGDEFVVLMPDTDEAQAKAVARRIVDGIRGESHQMSSGESARVGASAGLAVYPDDGLSPKVLLDASDAAMYAVKRAGGNNVRRGAQGIRVRATNRVAGSGHHVEVQAAPSELVARR